MEPAPAGNRELLLAGYLKAGVKVQPLVLAGVLPLQAADLVTTADWASHVVGPAYLFEKRNALFVGCQFGGNIDQIHGVRLCTMNRSPRSLVCQVYNRQQLTYEK